MEPVLAFGPADLSLLRQIVRHFRPHLDPSTVLAPLSRAITSDLGKRRLFEEYMQLVGKIDWTRLGKRVIFEPLHRLPSLQIRARGGLTFESIWPIRVAALVSEAGLDPHLEQGRQGLREPDLFVKPGRLLVPWFLPLSRIKSRSGRHEGGLAIECKAIQSSDQIDFHVKKVAKQLEYWGGGVAALDISAVIADQIHATAQLRNSDAWRQSANAAMFRIVHEIRDRNHLRGQPVASIAALYIHGEIVHKAGDLEVATSGCTVTGALAQPSIWTHFAEGILVINSGFARRRGIDDAILASSLLAIFKASSPIATFDFGMTTVRATGEGPATADFHLR